MSPERDPSKGQLDIPLVWETDGPGESPRRVAVAEPQPVTDRPPLPASAGRLLLAAFADLGVSLLTLAVAWAAAVAAGATTTPSQLALIVLVGLEVAALTMAASLWGWRGTVGMLLVDIVFARPLPAHVVSRVVAAWVPSLVVGGLPLVVGRVGRRGLERLAGATVNLRRPPAGA